MGQDYMFLNITKRQACNGAKFGEIFCESSPADIIKLLAIPEAGRDKSPDDHIRYSYLTEEQREPCSWAGDRVICIGDYATDWPDCILAADDCKFLESPGFLFEYAVRVMQQFSYSRMALFPQYSGPGVLRNLTKKIYVRSDGIPTTDREGQLCFFEDPRVDSSPGLGHVLMTRIGWSQDPSAAMAWEDADTLSEGEWAGDRFDVRSYQEVKAELESDGWVDVTDQEAKRFIRIWKEDGY